MMTESQLGGQAAQEFQERQLKAFTKAQMRLAGISGDLADPATLRKAYDEAGDKFNALAAKTQPAITAPIYQDMLKVVDDYTALKGVNAAPVLENVIQRVGTMAANNGGVLKGDQYKTLVTDIRKYAEGSTDVELKAALGELRETLDDAVEQSMGASTVEAWRNLRAQYRNLITLTEAVSGGGEMALQGIIDPVALNNAVRNNVGKRNYAKGYGDMNELSRAGRLVMPRLPDSGTATRTAAQTLGGLGTPAGIISYFASNGDIGAGLGAAALTAGSGLAPYALGRALLSAPGRAAVASGGSSIPNTVTRAMIPLLLGQ